jgi:2-amino-4-hydroxy-6-hydroxymethyldihydropteridine diphosphokinase
MSFPSNIIKATIAELQGDARLPLAFVSLGSNQMFGALDPESILSAASLAVAELGQAPVLMSSLWETEALDCPSGSPTFVNAVMALSSRINDPADLLAALQMIEQKFGRIRSDLVNAPRSLDLDLLMFGAVEMNTPDLVLPHPRMNLRRFVLAPLLEIAPDYRPAGSSLSGRQILASLPEQGLLRRMKMTASPVTL